MITFDLRALKMLRFWQFAAKSLPLTKNNLTKTFQIGSNLLFSLTGASLLLLSLSIKAQSNFQFPASVAVGASASVQSVPVHISAAGTVANVTVLTMGAENKDFTLVSAGDCAVDNPVSLEQTCTHRR